MSPKGYNQVGCFEVDYFQSPFIWLNISSFSFSSTSPFVSILEVSNRAAPRERGLRSTIKVMSLLEVSNCAAKRERERVMSLTDHGNEPLSEAELLLLL